MNRLETVLCVSNEQIGSDTLGRNAHRMMQQGALAPMVAKLQETLHGRIGGIVNETPLDILQHEEQQVALYRRLDGRSSETIAEAMGNWDPTLLVSDGYQPYKTIMSKEGTSDKPRRHQVCLIH